MKYTRLNRILYILLWAIILLGEQANSLLLLRRNYKFLTVWSGFGCVAWMFEVYPLWTPFALIQNMTMKILCTIIAPTKPETIANVVWTCNINRNGFQENTSSNKWVPSQCFISPGYFFLLFVPFFPVWLTTEGMDRSCLPAGPGIMFLDSQDTLFRLSWTCSTDRKQVTAII